MEYVSEKINDKLVLLNDFEDSFSRFEFANRINLNHIKKEILYPFRADIKNLLTNIENIELDYIRKEVKKHVSNRNFIVVMDDGSYFQDYDFNFNITRMAYGLEDIKKGPYLRVDRNGVPQIISQGKKLYDTYTRNNNQKTIVLCDDGVGSGKSLKEILEIFDELKIDISDIYVLLNPANINSINNNDITTILEIEGEYAWLSERDLFWGFPRSGITCRITHEDNDFTTGIPYTIDDEMIVSRIANFGENTSNFRKICLEYNIKFWCYIEIELDREILIKDIDRIKGLGCKCNISEARLVDYLKEINVHNYRFIM